jgi:hypothetical protein
VFSLHIYSNTICSHVSLNILWDIYKSHQRNILNVYHFTLYIFSQMPSSNAYCLSQYTHNIVQHMSVKHQPLHGGCAKWHEMCMSVKWRIINYNFSNIFQYRKSVQRKSKKWNIDIFSKKWTKNSERTTGVPSAPKVKTTKTNIKKGNKGGEIARDSVI